MINKNDIYKMFLENTIDEKTFRECFSILIEADSVSEKIKITNEVIAKAEKALVILKKRIDVFVRENDVEKLIELKDMINEKMIIINHEMDNVKVLVAKSMEFHNKIMDKINKARYEDEEDKDDFGI